MALTPTEEAQLRDLIAQQAQLLTLAANETTIISKLGATKVNLSQLTAASALADTDIALIRQGTSDKSMSASLLKSYVNSSVPTAAQFDSDTSPASTAFVHQALGNFSSHRQISTSQSLAVTDFGSNIVGIGVSLFTVTLPPGPNNYAIGSTILFTCFNPAGMTIACPGSDFIYLPDGTSPSSITLKQGDSIMLVVSGNTGQWVAIDGTSLLSKSASFAASFGTNSYRKLPSGEITQFGSGSTSGGTVNITFPIPFPNACRSVILVDSGAGSWAPSNFTVFGGSAKSVNGFTAKSLNWNGSIWTASAGTFDYIAIGN